MAFTHDVFISYAHLDNQELVAGQKGWVANFHRALEIRVGQYLGKQPNIWRDPKLQGNDVFAETLVTQVQGSAILISVLSPRYVRSDWTRREVSEFLKATGCGVNVGDKCRIFKVLKTPVPREEHPSELKSLLGYEFFKIDPETGRPRELDEIFGAGAQREFWMKVDDVAQDVCNLLRTLEPEKSEIGVPETSEKQPVFLAFTTSDVAEQREILRRDLQQHGNEVLPLSALGSSVGEVEACVREDLLRCRMSVHLVGRRYGVIPEDGIESVPQIQNRLAAERAKESGFTRLVWIPRGLEISDERQRGFVERLRLEIESGKDSDLLETAFEDLRSIVQDRLKPPAVEKPPQDKGGAEELVRLYYIYDQRDIDSIEPWEHYLFEYGLEVLRPMFEGDETEIREWHEENLRTCDAVLIHYGAANELWLRRKLREIQRSAGLGRTKPMRAVAILLAPPVRSDKRHFQTHEAIVIPQMGGLSCEAFAPFLTTVREHGKAQRT
jgi:TIR domain